MRVPAGWGEMDFERPACEIRGPQVGSCDQQGVDMTQVPEIFRTAATWAQGRPFGDPAGMAVTALLTELTGPPRIGVCTVDAPVTATIPDAVMVRTAWPAVGSGTDVVLLIHPGNIPGRVRSRMRAGPQKFVHIEDKEQAENYTLGVSELTAIREHLLGGELRALAARFPELNSLVPATQSPEQRRPRVVIIGPDPQLVSDLKTELAHHLTVVDTADADVVVAVPGKHGFLLADAPTIQDAWQRVGRLVTLSPLPEGLCPGAVPAGRDLATTITRLAATPARMSIPAVPTGQWGRALKRMNTRYHEKVRQLHRAGDRAGMRRLVAGHGLELPPDPGYLTRELFLIAGLILAAAIFRPDILPVIMGISVLRLVQQRQQALNRWWEEAHTRTRVDITTSVSRGARGPREWLRKRFHEHERAG